jgi:hypothetical protein
MLATLGIVLTAGSVEAKCSNVGKSPYSPITNDTVFRDLACDAKGGKVSFSPGAGYAFTGTSVARGASNGSVLAFSHGFGFTPKVGFKGQDRFVMRVCGTKGGQSGCSTLNYTVTIN